MIIQKRCFYCGKRLTRKNTTIDHKRPRSRGGSDSGRNKVLACSICNTQKGCLLLDEWRFVLAYRAGLIKTDFKFYGEK